MRNTTIFFFTRITFLPFNTFLTSLTPLCYTPLHLLFPFFFYGSHQQEGGSASALHMRVHQVGGLHPALRFSSLCSRRCVSDTCDDELRRCCCISIWYDELLARSHCFHAHRPWMGEELALLSVLRNVFEVICVSSPHPRCDCLGWVSLYNHRPVERSSFTTFRINSVFSRRSFHHCFIRRGRIVA